MKRIIEGRRGWRLESGELALEEALAAFEQGVVLVRSLHERLDAAEQRIELLVRGSDGHVKRRVSDVKPRTMIGVSAGFTFLMVGG